jgi:hypothetical protein
MGQIGCNEMSVKNYHQKLSNIPEKRRYYLLYGGSPQSRNNVKEVINIED